MDLEADRFYEREGQEGENGSEFHRGWGWAVCWCLNGIVEVFEVMFRELVMVKQGG